MQIIIQIGIALGIIIVFRILTKSLSYITIRMFKPKIKNKKSIKNNPFYAPLKVFYVVLGLYLALLFIRQPLNTSPVSSSNTNEWS